MLFYSQIMLHDTYRHGMSTRWVHVPHTTNCIHMTHRLHINYIHEHTHDTQITYKLQTHEKGYDVRVLGRRQCWSWRWATPAGTQESCRWIPIKTHTMCTRLSTCVVTLLAKHIQHHTITYLCNNTCVVNKYISHSSIILVFIRFEMMATSLITAEHASRMARVWPRRAWGADPIETRSDKKRFHTYIVQCISHFTSALA